jgi:hypothetical protein
MVIPIPTGIDYTSMIHGTMHKFVPCEQCGVEYVYLLERIASGSSSSFLFLDNSGAEERASAKADAALRRKLERGVDAVPCPKCGWYQDHMIPAARRAHRLWMLILGACLTIGVLPLGLIGALLNSNENAGPTIPWFTFQVGLAAIAILGIGLMIVKLIAGWCFDPNSQPVEARIQIGQSRVLYWFNENRKFAND